MTINATTTQAAMRAIFTISNTLENAKSTVTAAKTAAHEEASRWLGEWLDSGKSLDDMTAELTKNARALVEIGFFGSKDVYVKRKDGSDSRKPICSHNCEATLRFYQRAWKAEYSETYGVIMSGSTNMVWKDLKPTAEKTTVERIIDACEKGGLMSSYAYQVAERFEILLTEQERDTAALYAIAAEQEKAAKEAEELAQADNLRKAIAQFAKIHGLTAEETIEKFAPVRAEKEKKAAK